MQSEKNAAVATLVAHSGARIVGWDEVANVPTPGRTDTWVPVAHRDVILTARQSMTAVGFVVKREQYALARDDRQFFGTFDLESGLAAGVTLAVGVRNSTNKTLPMGFCAGTRVFVCDNLSFGAELMVKRRHTVFGHDRFREAIAASAKSLTEFQVVERERIGVLAGRDVYDRDAESFILRAWEAGLVSHLNLGDVLQEWREPTYPEFQPRTAWSLLNAFTTVLGRRAKNPQKYADLTMRLNGLAGKAFQIDAPALAA